MAVVMAAKRTSPMPSDLLELAFPGVRSGEKVARDGEELRDSDFLIGRHLSTASTDARQGWTWRG